jgi:phosphoenolpyruvate-protein kinase (PTS system EI component)
MLTAQEQDQKLSRKADLQEEAKTANDGRRHEIEAEIAKIDEALKVDAEGNDAPGT